MKFEKRAYVYFIYDVRGDLCYIGQTKWLTGRMTDHFKSKLISKVEYLTYRDKETVEAVESYMIDKYKPPLNRSNRKGLIDKGRELKDTFLVDMREVDVFMSDLESRYALMCLKYKEFPVDTLWFARCYLSSSGIITRKVECASNPAITLMFYEYEELTKVVVGRTMSRKKVSLDKIKDVYKDLPKEEGTLNTYITGVCKKIPEKVLSELSREDIRCFMKSRTTTINFN